MKISAFNNGQIQSNHPNFQARPLIIEHIFNAATIKPEDLGKASMDFVTFNGAKRYVVGILRKGLNGYNSLGDFLAARQVNSSESANMLYKRLADAVDMALTTDGKPIHLDVDYNIRP